MRMHSVPQASRTTSSILDLDDEAVKDVATQAGLPAPSTRRSSASVTPVQPLSAVHDAVAAGPPARISAAKSHGAPAEKVNGGTSEKLQAKQGCCRCTIS